MCRRLGWPARGGKKDVEGEAAGDVDDWAKWSVGMRNGMAWGGGGEGR